VFALADGGQPSEASQAPGSEPLGLPVVLLASLCQLFYTPSTVQDHIKSMLDKTESSNRSELIARVLGWNVAPSHDNRPSRSSAVTPR